MFFFMLFYLFFPSLSCCVIASPTILSWMRVQAISYLSATPPVDVQIVCYPHLQFGGTESNSAIDFMPSFDLAFTDELINVFVVKSEKTRRLANTPAALLVFELFIRIHVCIFLYPSVNISPLVQKPPLTFRVR